MRKYISKHRKILSILCIVLAAIIVTVTTIGVVNNVTAGVFKGQDDMDKEEKGAGNEVVILEIVPQYGQQILGYMIPGYEPITKEAIEAYPLDGPIDLSSADFKAVTGWNVKRTASGYEVNDSDKAYFYDAFNEGVFADVLNTTKVENEDQRELKLIVKQANDVAASDFDQCDLVYITNPKENNSNVLYYYDQVMNYNAETGTFSNQVASGNAGPYYDTVDFEKVLASELALRLIRNATGRDVALELEEKMAEYYTAAGIANSRSIFEIAGLDNYRSCNQKEYLEAIQSSEKGSLSDEEVINNFLGTLNAQIENAAINTIKGAPGNADFLAKIHDSNAAQQQEAKEAFKKVMLQANLLDNATGGSVFIEENFESYLTKIEATPAGGLAMGRTSIISMIRGVNNEVSHVARTKLLQCAGKTEEEIRETLGDLTTVFHQANLAYCNDYNFDAYVSAIANASSIGEVQLLELLNNVNAEQRDAARAAIVQALGNAGQAAALTDREFVVAELENYNSDWLAQYRDAIAAGSADGVFEAIDHSPVYDEPEENAIVLHFSAKKEYTDVQVQIEYELSEEDEQTSDEQTSEVQPEGASLVYEEGSNNYYRVVVSPLDAEAKVKNIKFSCKEGNEGNPEEFTYAWEADEVPAGEYWYVVDTTSAVRQFATKEEVVEALGEDYRYGDFITYEISVDKLEAMLAEVKKANGYLFGEVSHDFASFEVSRALIEYVLEEQSGLVFNSDIIAYIGNYQTNSTNIKNSLNNTTEGDRTNNLYKALVAAKLIGKSVFTEAVLEKIDDEGDYYAEGIGAGSKVSAWRLNTFGTAAPLVKRQLFKRVYTYSDEVRLSGQSFVDNGKFEQDVTATLSADEQALIQDKHDTVYTLGDVIRYTMNLYVNQLQSYPLRVLEIQPISLASDLSGYAGAQKLAEWLHIDYSDMTSSNYKNYFTVTSMGVREFNTQNKDLTGTYDLIYFGTNSGNMAAAEYTLKDGTKIKRTTFNDPHLGGCLYTAMGDIVEGKVSYIYRGSLRIDYKKTGTSLTKYPNDTYEANYGRTYNARKEYEIWKKYFTVAYKGNADSSLNLNPDNNLFVLRTTLPNIRTGANDITIKKSEELIEYLKAGYPILMEDEILNCDATKYITHDYNTKDTAAAKWTYVDYNSKLYHFIQDAKKLGYDETTGKYTGKDKNGNNVFADGGRYASLVSTAYARYGGNPEKLSVKKKFNGGLAFATQRNQKVAFEYISGPTEYDSFVNPATKIGTTIQYGTPEYRRYKIVLKIPDHVDPEWVEQNYVFQMYIDKSGLGTFTEERTVEMDPDVDFNYVNHQITIDGNWPADESGSMDGFVPWRLEAYRANNPNNHYVYTGYSAFQKVDSNGNSTKQDIEVLWLCVDVATTLDFAKVVDRDIPEYNIKLTTVTYQDFVTNTKYWPKDDAGITYDASNTRLKVGVFDTNASADRKDKEFDMLVFGYSDSYSGLDLNNINALKNIDYFVNAGHSLFFAHDNSSYMTTVLNYTDDGTNIAMKTDSVYFAKYNTAYMRSMLGMDLYGVSYSPKAFIYGYDSQGNPVTEEEADENTTPNPLYNKAIYNARRYTEPILAYDDQAYRGFAEGTAIRQVRWGNNGENLEYAPFKTKEGLGKILSVGINKEKEDPDQGGVTTTVRFINKGQVSMYPYALGDTTISTAKTHFQYMALNLEDEDTVVWCTLDSNKKSNYYGVTSGDGSNNYYIYTKGNITYTGAGHAKIGTDGDEARLFLNTVVAAIKAGNYGPEISYTNRDSATDTESVIYAYDTDKLATIKFRVSDVDRKKGEADAFSNLQIYFDKVGDGDDDAIAYDANDILLNTEGANLMRNAEGTDYINYTKENVLNRVEYTFTLSYLDIANKYLELHGDTDRYTYTDGKYYKNGIEGAYAMEIKNTAAKFFNEYRLAVTATDIPKVSVSNTSASGANGSATVAQGAGITTTAAARVAFRSMFNLN